MELAVTKHHFDQLRYGPPPEPFSGQIATLAREVADLQARNDEITKQNVEQLEASAQEKAREVADLRRQLKDVSEKTVERTKAKELARELKHRVLRRLASSLKAHPRSSDS